MNILNDDSTQKSSIFNIINEKTSSNDNSGFTIKEVTHHNKEQQPHLTISKALSVLKNEKFDIQKEDDDPIMSALNFLSNSINDETVQEIMSNLLQYVLIKDKLNSILFYIEFLFEKNYDIISNYFIQKLKNRNHRDTIIAIVLSLTKICDKLYNNISMLTSKKESNEIKLKIIDLSEEEKPNLLHDSKYQQIMNHLIEIIDVIYDFIVKENRNLTFSTIFTSDCVFSMITLILHCIQKGYNVSNLESILKTYKFMLELNSEWNYTNNRKLICYSIECTLTILNEFFSDKQSTKYKINSYKDDMISFLIDYSMIIREYAKDKIEDRKMIIKKFVKNIKKYIQSIEDNISNNPNIQSLIWVITRFILVICILGKLKREKSESIMDEIEIKEVMSKIENYYNNFEGVCNIQPILHFENEIKKYL